MADHQIIRMKISVGLGNEGRPSINITLNTQTDDANLMFQRFPLGQRDFQLLSKSGKLCRFGQCDVAK
jgi:hypothetical protein